jgi:hypothetical protein
LHLDEIGDQHDQVISKDLRAGTQSGDQEKTRQAGAPKHV